MELALGVFHWTEAAFWACSLRGWDRAVAGYAKVNGAGPKGMDGKRLKQLMAQYPDEAVNA